ncbi:diacylglycerol/lipid kinase family protein [Sphingomonas corticis]|jgi:YegS/Rv2252/BmrU family lipid kinase|uniref:YegS/Rv2252/BmrU family lipid kinase n=1 Tax=Sphingomonas corticis TaxID=2722791 RepID=A0ABX1CI40_9SPHN|nr:YegS/Rv2252/BmrU family lipid kinase [Sphingomonas corticis]NJR77034.1 YegS/Rv2252/BmrU family lipid kinase [Sphingomonas corticis]
MDRIKTAALIVNAKSRKGRKLFKRACERLATLPYEVEPHAVDDPKHLDRIVRQALAKKPDLVILGGGDGTVSGLVDLLVGQDVMLGVLPLGTANSFCRTLGIPMDIDGAFEVLRTGQPRRIDLGMIDDDYFANCAAMGLSPQIAETVPHNLKKVLGRVGYLGWASYQFASFRPFILTVDDGKEEHRMRVVEVRISNGPYHGGQWLVDEAKVDSGRIVVQAVCARYKRGLVKNWAASFLGLEARHHDTVSFSGTSLKVSTVPPLPISIDGEVLAHTPVTAHIAAGVIEVIAPRQAGATPPA